MCEPAQSKCTAISQEPLLQKFTGKMPQTNPADHTLRETPQSKYISAFHNSNFIRKFIGKMPHPSAPQNRGADFVRACAVEMHLFSTFPKCHFTLKFTEKKCRAPKPRCRLLCGPAQSTCTSTFHKSHFTQKFTGKK